jgi:hypothetical protein
VTETVVEYDDGHSVPPTLTHIPPLVVAPTVDGKLPLNQDG